MSSDDSKASSEEVDCPRGCGAMEYRKNKNMGRRVFHPLGTPLTFLGLAGIALALKSLNSIENEGALTNSEIITFIIELFPGVALLFLGLHFTSLVTSDLFCGTCNGIILESKSIDKRLNKGIFGVFQSADYIREKLSSSVKTSDFDCIDCMDKMKKVDIVFIHHAKEHSLLKPDILEKIEAWSGHQKIIEIDGCTSCDLIFFDAGEENWFSNDGVLIQKD